MESIRLATPVDIPHIARLANRDAPWRNAVRTQLTRGQVDIFLASHAAEPVGYAILRTRRFTPPSPPKGLLGHLAWQRQYRAVADPASLLQPMRIATVQDVFVRPDCRHRGLGAALISHGIEHAHSNGIYDVRVHLAAAEERLCQLYHRLGFAPIQVYLSTSLATDTCGTHAQEASRPATHRDTEPLAILLRDHIHHQQTLTSAFQLRSDINWQAHTTAKLGHRDIHMRVIEQDRYPAAFVELRVIRFSGQAWPRSFARLWRGRHESSPSPPYGVLQDVYVSPQLRRRGLAAALLQDAHRWFNAQGVTQVRAAIWHENHSSLRLFEKTGYEIDERVLRRLDSIIS